MKIFYFTALTLFLFNCKTDKKPKNNQDAPVYDQSQESAELIKKIEALPEEPTALKLADEDKLVVLVFDNGFDVNHEVFRDKILATYTVNCENYNKVLPSPLTKENYIEYLKQDPNCQITSNIVRPYTEFASKIDPKARLKWNASIFARSIDETVYPEVKDFMPMINSRKIHGTLVAGVIAYKNPNARLVLLDQKFRENDSNTSTTCPDTKNLEARISLMNDPEVKTAYINRSVPIVMKSYYQLLEKHKVNVINRSSGDYTYKKQIEDLVTAGCERKDWELKKTLSSEQQNLIVPNQNCLITVNV